MATQRATFITVVVLHYDGEKIDTDDAEVRVLTPDGQRIVAEFDLAKLL